MTERPIIFSAPMVRAILDGRKTQTRRVVTAHYAEGGTTPLHVCHPWSSGNLLWVREAWRASKDYDAYPPSEMYRWPVHYEADGAPDPNNELHLNGRLRPPIHMPRWASRITLRVTGVKVERLQDISKMDALAEGIVEDDGSEPDIFYLPGSCLISGVNAKPGSLPIGQYDDPRKVYRDLINNLHGGDLWAGNPWVAAITFERVKP